MSELFTSVSLRAIENKDKIEVVVDTKTLPGFSVIHVEGRPNLKAIISFKDYVTYYLVVLHNNTAAPWVTEHTSMHVAEQTFFGTLWWATQDLEEAAKYFITRCQ